MVLRFGGALEPFIVNLSPPHPLVEGVVLPHVANTEERAKSQGCTYIRSLPRYPVTQRSLDVVRRTYDGPTSAYGRVVSSNAYEHLSLHASRSLVVRLQS